MLIVCMAPRHFVSMWKLACCHCLVTNLCQTLCDPMDCRPPGSSTHGNLQSRILEWVTISFSRGSSWPRDWTQVSSLQADTLPLATREAKSWHNGVRFHVVKNMASGALGHSWIQVLILCHQEPVTAIPWICFPLCQLHSQWSRHIRWPLAAVGLYPASGQRAPLSRKSQQQWVRLGHVFVNYKLTLAKSICQWLNNNKGICHRPLWRLNPVLLQLPTFNTLWGDFRVEGEALCARGKLVEQVFK